MQFHSLVFVFVVLAVVSFTQASDPTDTKADANLVAAKQTQDKIEKMTEEMYTKLADVEKEYRAKRRPFYKDRSAAIAKIPGFWKKTFLNHPSHRNWLSDGDIAAIENLEDIEVVELDDQFDGHYKIVLNFKENALFQDKSVWRIVPSSTDGQEYSGVKWTAQQNPHILLSFFDGSLTDQSQISEIAHALRYDLYVNPFPYHDHVEVQAPPEDEQQPPVDEPIQHDEGAASEGEEHQQGGGEEEHVVPDEAAEDPISEEEHQAAAQESGDQGEN